MITESIKRLQYLCDEIPAQLSIIPEIDFTNKSAPGKWSKKEILGHLIDSATNNHQRFIRAQFENIPTISYDQDNWNKLSHYNLIDSKQLIQFWEMYNRHLIEIGMRIPEYSLTRECIAGGEKHTIEWLFNDYVKHMEYHLSQIVSYVNRQHKVD